MGEFMNCAEAMRLLRLSRETIVQMLRTGELRGFVRGRAVRIQRTSVDELINAARNRRETAGKP